MSTLAPERPDVSHGSSARFPGVFAGAGGLLFVATLVIQNVIRAKAPGFGADSSTVAAYFADHRTAAVIPLGLFPFGMVGIVAFVAGIWTTAREGAGRWWAHAGVLGAVAIVALFGLVNVVEIALTARARSLEASGGVVDALWALHAGAFGLDLAAIAVTLVTLSRAARFAGMIPAWLVNLTLPGAACLFIASIFTVAMTEGAPWMALGLIGFVVWCVFVVVSSISLLRRRYPVT
jgi:hypothetical protein